ncbi:FimB/Mfa2 family fimbrial subunit [Chitinophaga agrisoli]|uniref:FimB/Mfa2 family fimbrial subunit n=1 Tax=Chitinophaga agrisoli TaxID=2607653 RepID=A0A5B2VXD2_9BACT|nr:FimB/Mfa2 family fimbrial subunit [Chitinophaga agrisoli]KAA2242669.1 FimB/Mfa2 family fimbrial subunit [Chitinophaga agrisoli]
MRKLFLAVCALSLSLFACKKDTAPVNPETPGTGKKVALHIRAKDFLQQVEPIPASNNRTAGATGALRDSVLTSKVSFLSYLLYDASNHVYSMKFQQADDENFGTITDSAAPGNYTMVILASQTPLSVSNVEPLNNCFFSLEWASRGQIEYTPDIFFTKSNVAVTDGSDAMELNMTLDRVVGNLQVNILDMPQPGSGDTTMSIEIAPEAVNLFAVSGEPAFDPVDFVSAKVKRIGLNTFSAYVLNTVSSFAVSINYVDPATGQHKTKVINNVSCYKNRRTILSGYLYGGSAPENNGIKVILLDSWSGDDNEMEF